MELDTTQLQATLDELCVWMEHSGGVVSQQAPLLCKDIISYGQLTSAVGGLSFFVVSVVLLSISLWCLLRDLKTANDSLYAFWLLSIIGSGVIGLLSLCQLSEFVRATFMPRLYVVEELSNMLRNL